MSQRRWVALACLVAAVVAGTALADEKKPGSGQTSPPPAGAVSKMQADLAVTDISFTRIQLNPSAAPRKCYGYLFTYTIKNIGQMASGNFMYKVETAGQSGAYGDWSGSLTPISLKPGESFTSGPSPSDQQNWCVDDTWKPKVRVTADVDNKVHETNKSNNVLEKVFVPPHFNPAAVPK